MDKYETRARYNIAETCACSISISDLVSLSESADNNNTSSPTISTSSLPSPLSHLANTKLTYGSIRGSAALRTNIATNLYSSLHSARGPGPAGQPKLSQENILITSGAISGQLPRLDIGPATTVICHYPI